MKKKALPIFTALLLAASALSCTRVQEEDIAPETPAKEAEGTYTLSIQASKGADTKALADAGNTLSYTWTEGDEVSVYLGETQIGTLTAQSGGSATTVLDGTLTSPPEVDQTLTLVYRSPDYASQDGTLEHIAAHCDYSKASATVTGVSGGKITVDGRVVFASEQAIVKFTLKNGDNALNVSKLEVADGSHVYTVTPASGTTTNVLYVALPLMAEETLILTARGKSDDLSYSLTKTGASFDKGKFYRITAGLTKDLIQSVSFTPTYTYPTPPENVYIYILQGHSPSQAR